MSFDKDSWGTPLWLLDKARYVMGSIDTDPASNEAANRLVRATTFYTKETNGLVQPWFGNIFLNPPYSSVAPWIDRLPFRSPTQQAVVVVNNCTDAAWCQGLMKYADRLCFTKGRIAFLKEGTAVSGTRQGQIVAYLGPNTLRFDEAFTDRGYIPVKESKCD